MHDHGLGPAAGQVGAVADQHAGRDGSLGRPLAEARLPGRAAAAWLEAAHRAGDDRVHHRPARPVLLDHADHLVAQHRREGGERRQDRRWRARSAAPCRCRRCRPGSDARGPSPSPGSAGGSYRCSCSQGIQPPARRGRRVTQQAQRPLIRGRRAEAQPQAARRSGHLLRSGQSIGTRRTMLGPTRSRISSRLWPVMVRPWFLRPMTARDGSGACRTSSATSSASSSVPHG